MMKQRKWLIVLALVAVLLFCFGGDFLHRAFTHHGVGWWTFGGESYNTWSNEVDVPLSENHYKRQCLCFAGLFLFVATALSREVFSRWKKGAQFSK